MSGAEIAEAGDFALGLGFQVKIASTGAVFTVPATKASRRCLPISRSKLRAIQASAKRAKYLSGDVEHRDLVLNDQEHSYFTVCVSGKNGSIIVLDL